MKKLKRPIYIITEPNNSGWTAELCEGDDSYDNVVYIDTENLPKDIEYGTLVSPKDKEITDNTKFKIVKK